MSLRKSPTLTPALLASNRRNARKSMGPRSTPGKAISRLNRFRHGMRSPEFVSFFKALHDAPLGEVAMTARTFFRSQLVTHPLFVELAQSLVQADIEVCRERVWTLRKRKEEWGQSRTFKAGRLLKT
jgi:hypothetical protein